MIVLPVTKRSPELLHLLKDATTPSKVEKVFQDYMDLPDRTLMALYHEETPIGIIGLKLCDDSREMRHIAVVPKFRHSGVGRQLITYIFEQFHFQRLIAETDHEAVGFYRKLGFEVTSLGEKYPRVERFFCKITRRDFMSQPTLREAFLQAPHRHSGHGVSNVNVLKKALDQIDGSTESDVYGGGEVISQFEEKMANYLGKESALFFPSGTMAQQIALRIWCDEKENKTIAYHPLCHLEIHEEDGLKELHHLQPILLADKDRLITLEDVTGLTNDIACLLLELPQREIGGQLPSYDELVKISNYCRENGIRLHLDGARLYEVLPFYKKTAEEICSLFDSVYVSFYKGIGGVAGAILAGPKAFTQKSKVWKRRHGGDLISLYPYILSADYYFEARKDKMSHYYESAKELAAFYNNCSGIKTIPEIPVSNMFHVHIDVPRDQLEPLLIELYAETGLALTGYLRDADDRTQSYEVNLGDKYDEVPRDVLEKTFHRLDEKLQTMLSGKM